MRILESCSRAIGLGTITVILAAPALAHGGMYRGPGGAPGAPGGPTTPRGGPSSPTTGGGVSATDLTSWQFWWEFEKDRFLRVREAVLGPPRAVQGGGTQTAPDPRRPTPADRNDHVLPALARLLREHGQRDVETACMIAFAKIGHTHATIDVPALIRGRLADGNQEVRETAALALGISGLDDVTDDLLGLARDEAAGRKLTRRSSVDERTRAFATYGLGLLGRRSADAATKARVLDVAEALLEAADQHGRDIAVAAVQAIGVLRPDWSQAAHKRLGWRALQVLDRFWQRKLGRGDEVMQAHVPTAVARLLGRGSTVDHEHHLRAWIDELDARRRDDRVHQSIVRAIGAVAPRPEHGKLAAEASAALWRQYRDGKDVLARNFSLIALAQIGGAENRQTLMKEFARAGKGTDKPWAALALGLLAWDSRQETGAVDAAIGQILQASLRSVAAEEYRSACAVALGLCGYAEAEREMLAMLDRYERHDTLAGYLLIGLALLPAPKARDTVSAVLQRAVRRPFVVAQGAVSLALLGGGEVGDELLALWRSGDSSLARTAAVASAFRLVGDRQAIEPLIRMMFASDTLTLSRAFIAAALGGVCDKDLLPWNEPYANGINYGANVPTLSNGVTGVLDIL